MHHAISEKDQAAMAGMDALIKAKEKAEDAKCQAVLQEVKTSVNAEIYADIICELGESHTFNYDITTSPAGTEQDNGASGGKHFVNQTRNGGMTGDDFGGTMYIPSGRVATSSSAIACNGRPGYFNVRTTLPKNGKSAMAQTLREQLLEEGVTGEEIACLEQLAPLEQWNIEWESHLRNDEWRGRSPETLGRGREPGHYVTRVRCPKCGTEGRYRLNAVTDFHCDDDLDCGYDYVDDQEGLMPTPGVE